MDALYFVLTLMFLGPYAPREWCRARAREDRRLARLEVCHRCCRVLDAEVFWAARDTSCPACLDRFLPY